jgi:hypothetical protein
MPTKKKKQKQKKKKNIIVKKYITIKRIIKNENIQPRNENQVILPQSWNTTNSIESRITNALRDELTNTNNQFKTAYERQKEFNIKVNDNIGDIENNRVWEDENIKAENKQIKNQLSTITKRISKYANETPAERAERIKQYNHARYLNKKENALIQPVNREQPRNVLVNTATAEEDTKEQPFMQLEEKEQPPQESFKENNPYVKAIKKSKTSI